VVGKVPVVVSLKTGSRFKPQFERVLRPSMEAQNRVKLKSDAWRDVLKAAADHELEP